MQKISDLFGTLQRQSPRKRRGVSERGELLKYFSEKTGKRISYIAYRLTGLKLLDLYYLKSIADDGEKRGEPWGKVFWGSIKARLSD